MNTDGYYRAPFRPEEGIWDWLRFFPGGSLVVARSIARVETLAAWFGRDDQDYADGYGRYVWTPPSLTLSIADACSTESYLAQFSGAELHLTPQGRGPVRVYTFVPRPESVAPLASVAVKDEPPAAPVLPPVPLAWWRHAHAQGWRCQRGGQVPQLSERECWLDTSYCTECAIEVGR